MSIKCYSELIRLQTFEERYRYLRIGGRVGADTFGCDRIFNQMFYRSREWRDTRDFVIRRDSGNDYPLDLGMPGYEIQGAVIIHHINPITMDDIREGSTQLFDPENLITTRLSTHNAIHYGDESQLLTLPPERRMNDTCPWRK